MDVYIVHSYLAIIITENLKLIGVHLQQLFRMSSASRFFGKTVYITICNIKTLIYLISLVNHISNRKRI